MQIPFYNIKYKKMFLLPVWNREVYLSISPYLCQLCSQFEIIFFSLECIVSLFPGWPLTLDSPASASLGLEEVQACATLLDGS